MILLDDHIDNVVSGENVIITGSAQRVTVRNKSSTYLFVGLNDKMDGFELVNKRESVAVNDNDEKTVREFVTRSNGSLGPYTKLVAPSIIGYDHVKKRLLICAVNSGKDDTRRRRRVHVLLMGDTGLSKTPFLEYMVKLGGGNSIFTSAADSSTKALIGIIDPDEKILLSGPIPRSHGGICAIDEIGRLPSQDQGYILSAMQQGMICFGRYGFNSPLNASTTFICSANPSGNSGRLKGVKIEDRDIPLIGPLKDRFDIIFVFRTKRDKNDVMNYGFEKIRIADNYDEILKEEEENIRFLQKLITLAKKHDPKFSTEARQMIMKYYVDIMTLKDSKASPRLLDTLNNICYGIARLKLKDVIDEDDAKETIEFYNEQLKDHLSQIIDIPKHPYDFIVGKMIDRLTGFPFQYEWLDLLIALCKEDRWISEFCKNKYDKEDWNINNNKKVRKVREKLIEKLSSYRDRILVFNNCPLTIGWDESYKGDKSQILNIDDIIDDHGHLIESNFQNGKGNSGNSGNTVTDKTGDQTESSAQSAQIAQSARPTPENESQSEPDITSDKGEPDIGKDSDTVKENIASDTVEAGKEKPTAIQIFDSLMSNEVDQLGAEKEVLESRFIDELSSSGFEDIDKTINKLINDGFLERIVVEKDRVNYDMLRKVGGDGQ